MVRLEIVNKISVPPLNTTSIRRNLIKNTNKRFLKFRKVKMNRSIQENPIEFSKELSESLDSMYNTIENSLENTVIPDSSKLYVITNKQKINSRSLNFKTNHGELVFTSKQDYGKSSTDLPTSFKVINNDQLQPLFLKLNSLKSLLEKKLRQVKQKNKKQIFLQAVERFSEDFDDEDPEFLQYEYFNNFIKKELIGNQLETPTTTMVELSRFCLIMDMLNEVYDDFESAENLEEIKLPSILFEQKIFMKLNQLKYLITDYIKTKIKLMIKNINDSLVIANKQFFSLASNQSSSDNKLFEEKDQTSEVSEIEDSEDMIDPLDYFDELTIEDLKNNLSVFFSQLLALPRRLRLNYYNNYNSWINSYDDEDDFIISNRNTQSNKLDNLSILLGFLQKHDAKIYKKYIANENRNNMDSSLAIKVTSTKLAKQSLRRTKNSFEDKKDVILIIIPRFFEYEKINSKLIPSLNYSRYLETEYGMYNMPIYKTKPISKKILFAKNKFFNTVIKPKKIFTTLYRKEFKHLYNEYYKQRKGNLQTQFFYKFRDDYIDTTKGVIIKEREVSINKIIKIVSKIIKKIKTVNQLKIIKNFFIENSNEEGVLEKTDLFINKVSRNKNKINNKINNQV